MSAEHSFRWQHRTHARPTGHWHLAEKGNTRTDRYVLGSVEDCPECGPNDSKER